MITTKRRVFAFLLALLLACIGLVAPTARIQTLADGIYEAGAHDVRWNGTNAQGQPVSSGTYLYRLVAGDVMQTRVMVLAK